MEPKLKTGSDLYNLVKRLYPICRSITGNGVRSTLNIISEYIPLNINEVPSGKKVFDWEIPLEWNINDAWIKNDQGEKIVDFFNSNLHVLNYSVPVDQTVSLEELKSHLFSLPDHPDWIPYRTSYHNKNWGFCLAYNQLKELKEGHYKVKIDSTLESGSMTYGELFIPGKIEDEVLLTTHICHPSLCNDNLSGIAVLTALSEIISTQENRYSYRILFIPGTIGAIAWLQANESKVHRIKHGLVLNLLGDRGNFTFKKSRRGNAEIDRIVQLVLNQNTSSHQVIDFYPYGYDERQFCSPGFNLPVGRFSRTSHGQFPEYHTSADNLDLISAESLESSVSMLGKIIEVIESNSKFINQQPKCEPQLGKRGLYSQVGGEAETKEFQMALLWVLNYSDGKHSLTDISGLSGINYFIIKKAADALLSVDLLHVVEEE